MKNSSENQIETFRLDQAEALGRKIDQKMQWAKWITVFIMVISAFAIVMNFVIGFGKGYFLFAAAFMLILNWMVFERFSSADITFYHQHLLLLRRLKLGTEDVQDSYYDILMNCKSMSVFLLSFIITESLLVFTFVMLFIV